MKALILANGLLDDLAQVRTRVTSWQPPLVIAADGGYRHAAALALKVDVVIGDLDSLDRVTRSALEASGTHLEITPAEKDETDLELALLYAVRQGADPIAVLGALGGRLDMTLSNMLLLTHPALGTVRVELWNGTQTAWLIRPPGGEVYGAVGDTLSLVPLGGDAQGVTTQGLKYALHDEPLAFGPARGISNVLTEVTAHVRLRKGLLLAVHTPGRA